ncbi:fasciclin-like arabinogalactan protein 9 [Prosopis cineraria]|uniref:fasciclin-like arabinogalactan protein 9 n=1 Tax=Prosopis cineraria TaxID=364024 RepID=UPI00240EDC06|nr:fasciclin-like arabinogalactan protein 9 [Prosopis cineraria]
MTSSSITNMASSLALILLTLTPSLFLLLVPQARAQSAPAPAPAGALNLTGILDKGGQYTTLIRLLTQTQQMQQLQSQLNSTSEGFTVFAPTDNAFQNLKSGVINDLTDDQKVKLMLYHVTPKYYNLNDLLTVSNPVRTQASDWGLNFTGQGNQVNVSTGVVESPIHNALRQSFPLAVYQVDQVLLPEELFGDSPAPASSPKASKTPATKSKSSDDGSAPSSPSASSEDRNGASGRNLGFGSAVGLALICMGALF